MINIHDVLSEIKNQIIKRRGNLQNQQNADVKTAATRQCYVLVVICITFVVSHVIRISLAIHEIFVVDHYRHVHVSLSKFHPNFIHFFPNKYGNNLDKSVIHRMTLSNKS